MKVPAAALSILLLAATLGSSAHGYPAHGSSHAQPRMDIHQLTARRPYAEPRMDMHQLTARRPYAGFHHPSDCCQFFTSRKIRCSKMERYFVTTSWCAQPGVIFITKKGRHICANPNNAEVQDCIMNLEQDSVENLSSGHLI